MKNIGFSKILISVAGSGAARLSLMALLIGCCVLGCHRKTAEELLAEGDEAMGKRDFLTAEMKYEEALKKNPPPEVEQKARLGLGLSYMQDRDFARSREEFDKVIKSAGPQNQMGLFAAVRKIDAWMAEQKLDKALSEALSTSESLKAAPLDARQGFQMQIGDIYMANRNFHLAGKEKLKDESKAAELDKKAAEMSEKALEIYQNLIRQKTDNAQLHAEVLERISYVYGMQKDFPAAIKVHEDYLTSNPQTELEPVLHFRLGAIRRESGDQSGAEQSFDKSEKAWRGLAEKALGADEKISLFSQLALVQKERGHLDDSSKTLAALLDKYPVSEARPRIKSHIAELAFLKGNPQQAKAILQEVARENPETAQMVQQQIAQIDAMVKQAQTSGTLQRGGQTTGTLPLRRPADGSSATATEMESSNAVIPAAMEPTSPTLPATDPPGPAPTQDAAGQ